MPCSLNSADHRYRGPATPLQAVGVTHGTAGAADLIVTASSTVVQRQVTQPRLCSNRPSPASPQHDKRRGDFRLRSLRRTDPLPDACQYAPAIDVLFRFAVCAFDVRPRERHASVRADIGYSLVAFTDGAVRWRLDKSIASCRRS